MTVELDEKTIRVLDAMRAKAAARRMTLDAYLSWLVRAGETSAEAGDLPREEFDRLLDELPAGLPPLAPLPADFSRQDIYDGHD